MATALQAAKYLILLSGNDPEGEYMSPMRVQKLLYYAQGWSLALRNAPLFEERIQAWAWGPVVPKVYRAFKEYGRKGIPTEAIGNIRIPDDDRELLDAVWKEYKCFSAIRLSEMTHKEQPWKHARGKLPPESSSSREISNAVLKKYFQRLVKE